MASRTEQLFEALLNGKTADITPRSANEAYLLALCKKNSNVEWVAAPTLSEKIVYNGAVSLDSSGTTNMQPGALFPLTAGNTYRVTTSEGVDCECIAKNAPINGALLTWIGNNSLSSYMFTNNGVAVEDTGEAFCYYTLINAESGIYQFTSAQRGKRDITVKAIEIAEIREPIPAAYIPAGSGSPFFDFTLTDEDFMAIMETEEMQIEYVSGCYEAVLAGKTPRLVYTMLGMGSMQCLPLFVSAAVQDHGVGTVMLFNIMGSPFTLTIYEKEDEAAE